MNVTTIIFICISVILAVILLFRGNSNRSRISRDKESIDRFRTGVDEGNESNKRTEERLDQLRKDYNSIGDRAENSGENIQEARRGIKKAIGILERAEKRNNTKQN